MARRKVRRSYKRPGYEEKFKKFRIHGAVGRAVNSRGEYVFEACVGLAKGGGAIGRGYSCERGKNPRKALAAAVKTLAKRLNARKGAFAGRK